jgi:hypothetical protein
MKMKISMQEYDGVTPLQNVIMDMTSANNCLEEELAERGLHPLTAQLLIGACDSNNPELRPEQLLYLEYLVGEAQTILNEARQELGEVREKCGEQEEEEPDNRAITQLAAAIHSECQGYLVADVFFAIAYTLANIIRVKQQSNVVGLRASEAHDAMHAAMAANIALPPATANMVDAMMADITGLVKIYVTEHEGGKPDGDETPR